ncbi:radical SAM protein [Sandaracinus amylolyticus]|uniref:Molybdenum cofactor biosynthesis protein MoaA n=1 Tax=Sandaracinus amylolyticus TaxID=927083 RepID=A0A0F6YF69_9BACT|nr:radical SAM protein [Sandaracinus amylolyticus]AKF03235.1 Molybdenum cofactor biosynthesis protein MoaA [Sandaracinus amylolyticus]
MYVACFEIRRKPSDVVLAELRARIAGAVSRGARTIVISGEGATEGVTRVADAARGASHVDLVIDEGASVAPSSLGALVEVGVTRLVLRVLRRDPRAMIELARAWRALGRDVVVQLPIEPGAPSAQQRLAWLRRAAPELDRVELAPRAIGTAIADDVARAEADARKAKIELSLANDHPLPPCLVELAPHARRLLAPRFRDVLPGRPGAEAARRNDAHEACGTCALAELCTITSAELERLAGDTITPRPIADATPYARPGRNAGKRLRVLGANDVKTFFHVDYDYAPIGDGAAHERPTSRIGLVYRCNQTCTFCELADMDVDLSKDDVRAALDAARARGSTRVILTGGEPTLSRDLVDHVRYARSIGFEEIELQTNAVLLDKPGAARALADAGLTSAQVSLHGPDSAISDRLTAAPGTHARTLRGVDALLEAGVRVLLNHLIFVDNAPLLLDFVDLVVTRWSARRDRLVVQFHSPRNEFATREEGLRHVPRYSDYATRLRAAIDRARAAGLNVRDLQDPTGIPSLCVLGADASYLGTITAQRTLPRYHAWESDWLTRVAACEPCAMRDACMGVPKHYLALHGDAEFRPFTEGT